MIAIQCIQMYPISIRIPDDLMAAIRKDKAVMDRSLSWVIVDCLKGRYGNAGNDDSNQAGKVGGSGNASSLPIVRKAKSSAKRLHQVQSMCDELAGRGELEHQSKDRALPEDASRHEGHRIANQGHYCLTCMCEI